MGYLAYGAILAATLAVAAYKIQFYLIYASHFPIGNRENVVAPDKFGMEYENVELLTSDGERIHLYVIPGKQPPLAAKTVLFLGPNAGNIGDALPVAQTVHNWGYNVVLLSYRGYGRSTGSASEKGLKIDVDTTLKYINEHPTLCGTKLAVYGRSLGGAVAIYVASGVGSRYPRALVSGVILENTFASIPKLVPHIFPVLKPFTWVITQTWESDRLINQVEADLPLLFMAGGQDELIPPAMFSQLYQKCSSQKKQYYLYPRGMHNNTDTQPGYWDDLQAFLKDL